MLGFMLIDKPLSDATASLKTMADEFRAAMHDMFGDVVDEVRTTGERVGSRVSDAGELVSLALVVIGTAAVAALVLALIAEGRTRHG